MFEPHGPIKISSNRQIALPKALTERVRLEVGDSVYVFQSDLEPTSLVVVPVERVSEWIRIGRLRDPVGQQESSDELGRGNA
jgi:bifunctional DNA-binding transcriptional regulator/antitoxin component of YhaV-PrlF toxin-antitoxin module